MKIIKTLPWDKDWIVRDKTSYISLHHAKKKYCTVADIERWHAKENKWDGGFGYNYLVVKDGKVYEGRPIQIRGAHTKNFNDVSIGICFEGDFETEHMGEVQMNAGIKLIKFIKESYPDAVVKCHNDFMRTACPGKNFPIDKMREKILTQHWAEPIYDYLVDEIGMTIHDKRFDDKISRGEVMALMKQLIQKI
ncbi:unnamed protein product [marine sediment metagenome]|uniref:Peptidoglycan recognition protein family domain-containing protein n=1 Tax=marine sediment metagenome TaxID=412755 RepID=X1B2C5_9ZZZZ